MADSVDKTLGDIALFTGTAIIVLAGIDESVFWFIIGLLVILVGSIIKHRQYINKYIVKKYLTKNERLTLDSYNINTNKIYNT